jgi:uncharacterized protein
VTVSTSAQRVARHHSNHFSESAAADKHSIHRPSIPAATWSSTPSSERIARLRAAVGLEASRAREPSLVDRHSDFLVGGTWEETEFGPALYLEKVYRRGAPHGAFALDELTEMCASTLATMGCQRPLDEVVFLDLETTGLNGGTGTMAFLCGVARFEGSCLRLRQYFLTRPHFEPAMLAGLARFAEGATQIVSYNGASFDLPLLESRYTMVRQTFWPGKVAHLDLLPPARRFYKLSLESCGLKTVESAVLGVERGVDIPGWQVPAVYFRFVQEGVVGMMPAVVRHNALDVLSLVTLLRHLTGLVGGEPFSFSSEAIELARLSQQSGDHERSAELLGRAAALAGTPRLRAHAISLYLKSLKRACSWREARDLCLQELKVRPELWLYVEASKVCEHRTREHALALELVERALRRAESLSFHQGWQAALQHRRQRLLRKLGCGESGGLKGKLEGKKEGPSKTALSFRTARLPLPAQSLA